MQIFGVIEIYPQTYRFRTCRLRVLLHLHCLTLCKWNFHSMFENSCI